MNDAEICLCDHPKSDHYELRMPGVEACRGKPSCHCIKYRPKEVARA